MIEASLMVSAIEPIGAIGSNVATPQQPSSPSPQQVSAFNASIEKVSYSPGAIEVAPSESVMSAMVKPLQFIDNEASQIADYADKNLNNPDAMTPSDIVLLTTKSQEFMFHCQLTSNIANRTSDGIGQLLRQQS